MAEKRAEIRDSQSPYTIEEAAAKMRVSVWTVYRMVRDRQIVARRARGRVLIPAPVLQKWLSDQP